MNISKTCMAFRNRALALRFNAPPRSVLVYFVALFLCFGPPSQAQVSKGDRKLVTRVEPDYPPVLKVRQIGGTVRLELTITQKGTVKSVSILGGNPVLAESAIAAVKQWVYAPADAVTTEKVSLEFNPYR
jgi:TonB family protein